MTGRGPHSTREKDAAVTHSNEQSSEIHNRLQSTLEDVRNAEALLGRLEGRILDIKAGLIATKALLERRGAAL